MAEPADTIDWPLWWFLHLEAAFERGDHEAAAKAQRELARLGVHVTYSLPAWARKKKAESHNPRAGVSGRQAPPA